MMNDYSDLVQKLTVKKILRKNVMILMRVAARAIEAMMISITKYDQQVKDLCVQVAEKDRIIFEISSNLDTKIRRLHEMPEKEITADIPAQEPDPIPMLLHCPICSARHIDVGEYASKPHHTHACQDCGHVWRPAVVATVGVRFLPGYKNVVGS